MNEHITVLRDEAILALALKPSSVVVDATFGSGGHSREIASHLSESGTLIAIDVDESALRDAESSFAAFPCTKHFVTGNFKNIKELVTQVGLSEVDAVMADLGWRMEQFVDSGKGFSFQKDEPLLMTLGDPKDYLFTAHDIVNDWEEENITDILYGYGEERSARKIAAAIVKERTTRSIDTAKQLSELITSVTHRRGKSAIHPATKSFQALRIAVNDELGALKTFTTEALTILKSGGRLGIITFHSTEDRIVKHMFRDLEKNEQVKRINKKPIAPDRTEIMQNRRARSAKLRIIEKI